MEKIPKPTSVKRQSVVSKQTAGLDEYAVETICQEIDNSATQVSETVSNVQRDLAQTIHDGLMDVSASITKVRDVITRRASEEHEGEARERGETLLSESLRELSSQMQTQLTETKSEPIIPILKAIEERQDRLMSSLDQLQQEVRKSRVEPSASQPSSSAKPVASPQVSPSIVKLMAQELGDQLEIRQRQIDSKLSKQLSTIMAEMAKLQAEIKK